MDVKDPVECNLSTWCKSSSGKNHAELPILDRQQRHCINLLFYLTDPKDPPPFRRHNDEEAGSFHSWHHGMPNPNVCV